MSADASARRTASTGVWLGVAGVVGFSLTLPVTRYADPAFGPELVGPGRALFAAVAAAVLLLVTRRPLLPPRRAVAQVAVVTIGSVIGFPLLTAYALRSVSASHAAVTIAFLPAATAVMGVVWARERPSNVFWLWCAFGTALIAGYLALGADTRFGVGDVELFGSVVLCAIGYAQAGVLSRHTPGWVISCWSLIIGFPAVLVIVLATGLPGHTHLTWHAVSAFVYLAFGSSLLAFFCWYRALALGGITRISQIQLLQPVLTMLFAALLLSERLSWGMILVGLAVGLTVLMAQRTRSRSSTEVTPSGDPVARNSPHHEGYHG